MFLQGMESNILVRTNMSNEEITLIIGYFFQKLCLLKSYTHVSVTVEIGLPEMNNPCVVKSFKHMIRSIKDVNIAVRTILSKMGIETVENDKLTEVIISANQIMLFVRNNRIA